jgi:cytochrome P450
MEQTAFDLTDPDCITREDIHEHFKYLREQAPISRITSKSGRQYWAVVKYRDVMRVWSDPVSFSSEQAPISLSEHAAFDHGRGKIMILTDPPHHMKQRNIFKGRFTPRNVNVDWEGLTRTIVRRLFTEAAEKGECDFVAEVAGKLPRALICEVMGVSPEDRPRIETLGDMSVAGHDPEYQKLLPEDQRVGTPEEIADRCQSFAMQELSVYFAQVIQDRRKNPRDDLFTLLAQAVIDGVPISDEEAIYNCVLLLDAGLDTTRNALSGGILALLRHPDQLMRLTADPALVRSAIEEFLRWSSPAYHNLRVVRRDTEIRGQVVREGEVLTLWGVSANRDEEIFPHADKFDITRWPNEHIAFGYGEHSCIGSHLARLELRVGLEEALPYLRHIEVSGPIERMRSLSVPGIKHMPVRFGIGPQLSAA